MFLGADPFEGVSRQMSTEDIVFATMGFICFILFVLAMFGGMFSSK